MTRRRAGPGGTLASAAGRACVLLAVVVLAVAAAPATLVAAGGIAAAWRGGWPPRRLFAAAAWCGPMVAVWVAATALAAPGWLAGPATPFHAWLTFWRLAGAGSELRALAAAAPIAIPAGLAAAGLAWSYRIASMRAGTGGRSPGAPAAFDERQWRHQVRAARALIAAPGSVPLTLPGDQIAVGSVIRAYRHGTGPVAAIGYRRMRAHQVVIGTTGTGKTTLLLRLWTGYLAAGLRRHAAGMGSAPLIVVLDCKGGADARRVADRFRRVLREAGARSTAIWPDEASLSLWTLPPRQLTTTLVDLIEHGTGSAAYYADVMEALVGLAVEAPCGPPASAGDLLARLEPGWLAMAYAAEGSAADHAVIKSASRHLADVALRFRTLFRRLGPGLDGPGGFGDADAWYCILEGTDQITVAEGQARALVDLLASFAVRGRAGREVLLAVDEFSAVARRLPIWQLYERARSLGLAVQVSAQSWQGLAATEDERYRIAAAAEGGIWLLRTPHPEPVARLAGMRSATQASRALGHLGSLRRSGFSRPHDEPVVDTGLIRRLDVGQTAYIHAGGVSYIQIKRLVAVPAAVGPAAVGPAAVGPAAVGPAAVGLAAAGPTVVWPAAAGPASADAAAAGLAARAAPPRPPGGVGQPASGTSLPDVGPLLDAAFGPEPKS